MAEDPQKPYGDVHYADPGYQDDGKARYPLDTADHCRAAWSYINQADNAAKYTAEQLATVKGHIRAAAKKYGVQIADDTSRALSYQREWALDDIIVRAGGDGRTVEAYAAVFDIPAEVRDQHGHYMEVISRSAFNRTLSHGIGKVGVFYHHGMTLHGTPSDLGAVPIGSPQEITPDGKGLRTITRFNKSQLADSVLESIRNGDITGYSFRGRIVHSSPDRVPAQARNAAMLPTITRTELGLAEYGPTPTPVYAGAGILAVRSAQELVETFAQLDPDIRADLVRMLDVTSLSDFSSSTPDGDSGDEGSATANPALGSEDSPIDTNRRSGRLAIARARMRMQLSRMGAP